MLATKPRIESVKLADISMDKHTQMRAGLNRNAILDYAEAEKDGAKMPPIVVFRRVGIKGVWVGDGWHRILARKRNGGKTIEAEIRDGSRRDAMLYAAGANREHGVRRTNEDKRKAVIVLLKDSEWKKWADTEIGKACGVSASMVAKYRDWLRPEKSATDEEVRSYIDRRGETRTRTVPRPMEDPDLGAKLRHEKCPYCGQIMNR